jgi:predicted permease
MLLGEPGFALVPFYKLLEELWNYSILFPIARAYGERANQSSGGRQETSFVSALMKVLRDPFLLVSLTAISLGLALNFTGISRPAYFTQLNTILVPAGTILLLFAIGMSLRFTIARQNIKAGLLIVLGKSIITPIIVSAIALALGLGHTPDALGLKLVFIMAAMPAGFVSMVPPTLYKLDQDLAGALWLVSNTALLAIVPALALLMRI